MIIHSLVKKDDVIYWEKIGVDDEGDAILAAPVIIQCRWDAVNRDVQADEANMTETAANSVYPDRVLTIGGFLMLGNQSVLNGLSEDERRNPRLLRTARAIKSQSTVFELGWEQTEVLPGFQSDHITIDCQI